MAGPSLLSAGPTLVRHAARHRRQARQFSSTPFVTDKASIAPTFPTLQRRHKAGSRSIAEQSLPEVRIDHLVIGGGVVGLAITYALARRFPDKTTYLVERHQRPGEETSSRNSEVIHAGLFYPPASLKTNLCLRGRELLYDFCQEHGVPFRQTGKLVVGTSSSQQYLQGVLQHVESLKNVENNVGALVAGPRAAPPVRLISGDEARELEPDLGKEVGWTLESSRTGIVDSHELMATLERLALDSESADIVYDTSVVGIRPLDVSGASNSKRGAGEGLQGWLVDTQTMDGGELDTLLARHVINASGLNGPAMLNSLVRDGHFGPQAGPKDLIGMWYSKGNYASYSKSKGGVGDVKRLIYPLPDMGGAKDKHAHQGLGTHLTLDMLGNIRFGPDTDWLIPPPGSSTADGSAPSDWWSDHLVALQPSAQTQVQLTEEHRLDAMHQSVTAFLPGIARDGLSADYAGIRPKLVGVATGFADFAVYHHYARNLDRQAVRQNAFNPDHIDTTSRDARDALYAGVQSEPEASLVSLCGIESPGLTSSLALADVVVNLIGKRGWGLRLDAKSIPKGAQNEDAGHIDQWA